MAVGVVTVADDLAEQGFYIEPGTSISESDASEIVSAARNSGSRFYLAVLDDTPLGGNVAFAESLYEDLSISAGTVLVISPDDVGWLSEDEGFTEADMADAYDFANSGGSSDAEYAANFVVGLFGESVAAGPATDTVAPTTTAATAAASSESSGGGGSGFLWFIVIIAGLGLLMWWLMRKSRKPTVNAAAEQMAKARLAVQKQVDAVANDILDMEDEVRLANNSEVDRFYNEASETYRGITDRLQKAESPQDLIDISNDLDVAIWQLDSAEAVLDGKPKPPRPEAKKLEPQPRPAGQDRVTVPAPRPDYQRRPSRRSSYLGPGMLEMLIGVAGQVLAGSGRGRRPRGGGLGSMFGHSAAPKPPPPPSSGSSGGGVVPGPGSPVPRSGPSRRSTSTSTSTRRRGGGRIRGGGRRRK
jgi:hypothetical protein